MGQQMADLAPHFVLHVGDIVYDPGADPDAYQAYQLKYYSPFLPVLQSSPLYPAVGNHDVIEPGSQVFDVPLYYSVFPPFDDPQFPPSAFDSQRKWYAFEANGVQFISLDTQTFFGETGRQEMMVWLEERLADTRFDYSIVFMHVPPYTSGLYRDEVAAVRSLAAMFEEAGVPVVFAGHDHNYQRLSVGPTTYLISGGGSRALYGMTEEDPHNEFFAVENHFLLVEIASDVIEVRAIAADGDIIDEVSLPTPP